MQKAIFAVSLSVNNGTHFDALPVEVVAAGLTSSLDSAQRLFRSSGGADAKASLCVGDSDGKGQYLLPLPSGTAKKNWGALPSSYLVEAVHLFEPKLDLMQPDGKGSNNIIQREQILAMDFPSEMGRAILSFHSSFKVSDVCEKLASNTGITTFPAWIVKSFMESMRHDMDESV